jgi:2-oxoglutarate dehydrogenase E2 component (dihydrolipoamide succinyltransferase)
VNISKLLDEKNIAPASINGSGKAGRITKEDAVNAVLQWELLLADLVVLKERNCQNVRKVAERLLLLKTSNYFQQVNMTLL